MSQTHNAGGPCPGQYLVLGWAMVSVLGRVLFVISRSQCVDTIAIVDWVDWLQSETLLF